MQDVENEEVRAVLLKEAKKQEVRLSKDCFSEGLLLRRTLTLLNTNTAMTNF